MELHIFPPSRQPKQHPNPLGLVFQFGSLNFIAGASGTGKTALLADILKRFADGRAIFGHQPAPLTGIGVVVADRGWAEGPSLWFDRVGYSNIAHYALVDDVRFDPKSLRRRYERADRLLEFIDKLKLPPGGLVLVDPIGLFLGGNLNDYDTCAVACHELRVGLRDRQLTLLATAHTGKMRANKQERFLRAQDAIIGSAAQHAYGDTQCYLAGPDELGKPHYAFMWQPHLAKAETFLLTRTDDGLFVSMLPPVDTATTCVLALFPEVGIEITLAQLVELAAAIPLTRRSVLRALTVLVEKGQIRKVRHGVYLRVGS